MLDSPSLTVVRAPAGSGTIFPTPVTQQYIRPFLQAREKQKQNNFCLFKKKNNYMYTCHQHLKPISKKLITPWICAPAIILLRSKIHFGYLYINPFVIIIIHFLKPWFPLYGIWCIFFFLSPHHCFFLIRNKRKRRKKNKRSQVLTEQGDGGSWQRNPITRCGS